jgi:hypothetical protein
MFPGRLRECLKTLSWSAADLAEQLGCPQKEVTIWLEALVKAHRSLPPPSLGNTKYNLVNGPIELRDVDIAARNITDPGLEGIMVQPAYQGRATHATAARHAPPPGQRKGVSNHATQPL